MNCAGFAIWADSSSIVYTGHRSNHTSGHCGAYYSDQCALDQEKYPMICKIERWIFITREKYPMICKIERWIFITRGKYPMICKIERWIFITRDKYPVICNTGHWIFITRGKYTMICNSSFLKVCLYLFGRNMRSIRLRCCYCYKCMYKSMFQVKQVDTNVQHCLQNLTFIGPYSNTHETCM